MSRKLSWAGVLLALSVLIAIPLGKWSVPEKQGEAADSTQNSSPSTPPPSKPLASGQSLKSPGVGSTVAGPGKTIRVVDGLLTVVTRSHALGAVLEEIGRQSGIAFHVPGNMAVQPISVALHEVPFEQGLARVLADYDSVYYFGAGTSSARSLRAVWVYPPGQGQAFGGDNPRRQAGQPLDASLAYRSAEQRAADADPAIRLQAISALAEGTEPGIDPATARAALQTAISDPDPQVRAQALNGLVSSDPGTAYAYQVQGLRDADPAVRLMAVGTLTAEGPGLALLQAALNDPDEAVQLAARLQLERNKPK